MRKSTFTLVTVILFCGCSSTSNESEAGKERTGELAAVVIEKPVAAGVLNPNLATSEEISSLGLDEAGIEKLMSSRPYLDPLTFLSVLKEAAGEEQFDEIKKKIFLPMNLNTTAEENFKMVPYVGDKMAHEFEEYRPYRSIKQFRREVGKYVSREEVAMYENYIFVPVNLNDASKEEILSIPGVGDKMAHEFEEYRPYKNIEQFRRAIGKYVDDDELNRLVRYVTL